MQILETKISIPPVPANLVSRNRLTDKLDQLLHHKLTLITAPAGSGKTTLISEWITGHNYNSRVAWVSLDERENEPVRFWNYVISSLDVVTNIDFSGWFLEHQDSPQVDLDTMIDKIIHEVDFDFVLILDDYHFIHSEAIHEGLTYLLSYLPTKMHLVITSRTYPPLPLEEYRVHAQLTELTQQELQFTIEEAGSFFKRTTDRNLTSDDVSQLTLRTEGWVAGLQLAAFSLQTHEQEDVRQFARSFSGTHQFVDGFIREQVFEYYPEEIREFLLDTSILGRFNAPLCNAVTGLTNGQETLKWLEKNNLFLVRLGEKEFWYRYHSLLSDFLQNYLLTSNPERAKDLYLRAASWCEENNSLEEAIQYALEAKDYKLTTKLLSQTTRGFWNRGEVYKISSWLKDLPDAVLNSRPILYFTFAWLNGLRANIRAMEGYIYRAEGFLQNSKQPFYSNYSDIELNREDEWTLTPEGMQALLNQARMFTEHFSGNTTAAIALGQNVVEQIPPQYIHPRGIAYLFLGHAYLSNYDLETANHVLLDAVETNRFSAHYAAYLNSSNQLALLNMLRGQLNAAFEIYQQAAQFTASLDEPVLAGIEDIGLGNILLERNDLEKAESHLDKGLKLAEAGGDFMFMQEAYIGHARLEQTRDKPELAWEFIQKAERLFRNSPTCIANSLVQAWALRIWLAQGEVEKASYWNSHPKFDIQSLPAYHRESWLITRARVFLAEKRLDEAGSLLEQLLASTEAGGRNGITIEILILLALLYQEKQSLDRAQKFLIRALELAQPENYVRIFVDEGENMKTLLEAFQQTHMQTGNARMPKYVDHLIQSFTSTYKEKTNLIANPNRSNQPLIEPLSERELQVLILMGRGKSYEHIAQELVIALSTVRWHAKNIFRKLNAHTGLEAIAIARELKILQ